MKTKFTRSIALLLCALMMLGAFAACGKTDAPAQSQGGSEGGKVKEELIIAMSGDIKSLDPMKNWQTNAYFSYWSIYERLFYKNPATGAYEPELAKSWDIAEDGSSYTFYLQENVKWHDGTPFTAKDVKYTVERALELGTGNYPGVASAEIIDDYTIKIVMSSPDSVFMDKQWTGDCCVVKDGTDEELAQTPIGTGPFKFGEWVSGDHITLEAFDGYWREQSGTKKVTFRIMPEANARVLALQAGDVDIAMLDPANVPQVTADANLQVLSNTSNVVTYLGFNCTRAPFDNELVRKAIGYAIDKEAIVTAQLDGQGVTISTFVGQGNNGHYDGFDHFTYDPAKAKELLAQAGFPNGFETVLVHSASSYALAAQLIQANLADIGITVKIEAMESAAYSDYTKNGNADMFIGGRGGGSADSYLMMLDKESLGANGNVFFYANDEYDDMLTQSHLTIDNDARNELYRKMQEHINEHTPVLPLYSSILFVGVQKNVKDVIVNINGAHDFRNAYAIVD